MSINISKYIVKQIKHINSSFIETSFQIDSNQVSDKNGLIVWEGFKNIAFTLKNIPYITLYKECIKERAFNLQMIDGALIQFMYKCHKDEILEHRLAFYPNPEADRYQDDPENYENIHFGNELFAEVYDRNAIVFPIRFDFCSDPKIYKEHDHTYSHLTLGNYKNCRIPVAKPISPNRFILFILRNFYFDRFKQFYTNNDFDCDLALTSLLSESEKNHLHFNF